MNEIAQRKIGEIELLRWPMAVLVVCIHADFLNSDLLSNGRVINVNDLGSVYLIITYISQILGRIAVPLFFMISGYLFFRNFVETASLEVKLSWYKKKIKGRVSSLLVPLISWNLLMCTYFVLKQYTPIRAFCPNLNIDWTILAVISAPFDFICDNSHTAPIDNPLWFVRNLFFIALLTPIFFKKRIAVVILGLCTIVWMFNPKDDYSVLPTIIFFISGGALSMYNKAIYICRTKMVVSSIAIMYLLLSFVDLLYYNKSVYCQPLHNIAIMVGCVFALSISSLVASETKWRIPSLFSESSFVIFAFHSFVLYDIQKIMFRILFNCNLTSAECLFVYSSSIAFSVVISMLVYLLIKKNSFLSFLFIGR